MSKPAGGVCELGGGHPHCLDALSPRTDNDSSQEREKMQTSIFLRGINLNYKKKKKNFEEIWQFCLFAAQQYKFGRAYLVIKLHLGVKLITDYRKYTR